MLQYIRKTIQISVIAVILAITIISYYGYLLSAKGQKDLMDMAMEENGYIMSYLYAFIHKIASQPVNSGDFVPYLDIFKGGAWSLTLFGFNITDPVIAIATTIASKVFYIPLLISIIIPLVFILIFGRAFCGWICPMNFLFELNEKIRKVLERFNVPILNISMSREYKYFALFSILTLSLFGIHLLPYILPYALVSRELYHYIFYSTFSFGMILILSLLVFELLVSRRGWCKYLCPGGAFFSLLGFKRLVGIDVNTKSCPAQCSLCTEACPRGLEPHKNMIGIECDNCGLCISKCPAVSVKYKFGVRSSEFGVKAKIICFLLFLLLTPHSSLLTVSHAAHAKIINPHAGAQTHYPQNPSEEYFAEKDDYVIHFSAFQHKQSDATIRVKAVAIVKEKETGQPYLGPLRMVFYRKSLFGMKEDMRFDFEKDFEKRYPFYANLPYEGDFVAKVSFNASGKEINVEFPMKVGETKTNLIFLGFISFVLISSIITVAYLKKKQQEAKKKVAPVG
ncbi:MAG: 4Fe-4S binding protein [Deltaproteobacteria bacterium]|nr:4Fe-4S binding protein [Deltaproteobacteria bacterium]